MSMNPSLRPQRLALALGLAALAACAGGPDPARPDAPTCPPGTSRAARQAICIAGPCGNGMVDPDEACDDGNRIAGDGCSADCQSAEVCGNGIVDQAAGEVCDDSNIDPDDQCWSDCRPCPALATPPPPPAPPPCVRAELEQALAEATAARAQAEAASARAAEASERARTATQRAVARSRAAARSRRKRARLDQELARARDAVTALERANSALSEALSAERQQNDQLLENLTQTRSASLE